MIRGAFFILFLVGSLAAAMPAMAEKRGFVAVPLKGKSVTVYKRSYALVIGIDHYTNGWPVLGGAIADAKAVAAELKGRFGEKNVTLLTSKNRKLTKSVLAREISRFLLKRKHSHPDVRLFIWFAGHGHSVPIPGTVDEHIAYIVGADAPVPPNRPKDDWDADAAFQDKAIPLSQFDIWMRGTRAKHVMAVFDSCFSGGIFAKRSRGSALISRATTLRVRQFISSGQAGQEVSDDGQFRKRFIDAITGRDPRADQNGDGYILGSELGQYLYQKITASSYGRQTPRHGTLPRAPFDRGDFVFRVPGAGNGDDQNGGGVKIEPDPQVKRIQQLLASVGYNVGKPDGLLGDKTRAAIRAYQQKKGLPADGQISIELVFRLSDEVRGQKQRVAIARPPKPLTPETLVKPAVGVYPDRFTPGTTFDDCNDAGWCPSMVVVPKGSFMMGSPQGEKNRGDGEDNKKGKGGRQVRVTIPRAFAVGRFEITRGQFHAFVKATGYKAGNECHVYDGSEWKKKKGYNYRKVGFSQTDKHPVACVNWNDAKAYVKWLNKETKGKPYRLLSEAEWEYVARAGSKGPFSWSGKISTAKANYDGNYTYGGGSKGKYRKKTVPVDSFKVNAFGLYNVHGNVWEWVEDCYQDSYKSVPTDGSAKTTGSCVYRVLRGGSWVSIPGFLRSAVRSWNRPDYRIDFLGFRVARSLPSPRTR